MQSTCPKTQMHPHATMSQQTQRSHPQFLLTCPHPLLSLGKSFLTVLFLSTVTSLVQTSIISYRSPHRLPAFTLPYPHPHSQDSRKPK